MAKNKGFRCTICKRIYTHAEDLYDHYLEEHGSQIPSDMSPAHFHKFKITGKTHGKCGVCGKPTDFNEDTKRFKRYCCKKCQEVMMEKLRNGLSRTNYYDKMRDVEHQKKLLANRKISGEYKFADGGIIPYVGTYELEFLKFLDIQLNFHSSEIVAPSPITFNYKLNGVEKQFYSDFYLPNFNLLVEIKMAENQNETFRMKEQNSKKNAAKEAVILKQNYCNYLRISNKNHVIFLKFLDIYKEMNERGIKTKIYLTGDHSSSVSTKDFILKESIEINDKGEPVYE